MAKYYEAKNLSRDRVLSLFESDIPSDTPFHLTISGAGMQANAYLSADDLLELEALLISARQRGVLPARAAA